jgi:isopenicillin N synthase-like dioxygenase
MLKKGANIMQQTSSNNHSAFTELPIVDISLLYSNDIVERQKAASYLDQAIRDAGFIYLKGHQIPEHLILNLKAAVKEYFAQDLDSKQTNYIGLSANHTGYVPQGEEQFYSEVTSQTDEDLKEAYDIGPESPSLMARFVNKASVQWPDSQTFKNAVCEYYAAMLELSKTLFKGFALALNLPEDTFSQHLSLPPSQLRLIHYFDNPNADINDSGIGAHTDYEFFTILLPTAPGLQVLNGVNEWINVPLLEDCFIINVGDMMELVSNGQYSATSHRVRQVKEERYAFPFFCSLDYDTVVAPIGPLNDDSPYKSVICGDHLLAQTCKTFSYLKKRKAHGELDFRENPKNLLSHKTAANE